LSLQKYKVTAESTIHQIFRCLTDEENEENEENCCWGKIRRRGGSKVTRVQGSFGLPHMLPQINSPRQTIVHHSTHSHATALSSLLFKPVFDNFIGYQFSYTYRPSHRISCITSTSVVSLLLADPQRTPFRGAGSLEALRAAKLTFPSASQHTCWNQHTGIRANPIDPALKSDALEKRLALCQP